jgi:anti-anti-sigma factor
MNLRGSRNLEKFIDVIINSPKEGSKAVRERFNKACVRIGSQKSNDLVLEDGDNQIPDEVAIVLRRGDFLHLITIVEDYVKIGKASAPFIQEISSKIIITVGDFQLSFSLVTEEPEENTPLISSLEETVIESTGTPTKPFFTAKSETGLPPENQCNAVLNILNGDRRGQSIKIDNPDFTIGRRSYCDLVFSSHEDKAYQVISGRHCKIMKEGSVFKLTDLDSKNKTAVNGEIVSSKVLKNKDIIELAHAVLLQFFNKQEDTLPQNKDGNFSINVKFMRGPELRVLEIRGKLTRMDLMGFQEKMTLLSPNSVLFLILNLGALEFIDTEGLSLLQDYQKKLKKMRGKLLLCCVKPKVFDAMKLIKLHRKFKIFETEGEAIHELLS